MSKDALSGVGLPDLESQDDIGPEPSSSDLSNRLDTLGYSLIGGDLKWTCKTPKIDYRGPYPD
ncbi:hypothetical protein RAB80_015280 [Fusarium oxysporum f. sp. vasinfectum]|nr:hypothetical protein RAB80_015280 [Fusarium oxysporum f. sp. vasinfectum]